MSKKIRSKLKRQLTRSVVFPSSLEWQTMRLDEGLDPQEYLLLVIRDRLKDVLTLQTKIPEAESTTRIVYLDSQDIKKCFQVSIQLNKRIDFYAFNPHLNRFVKLVVPWFDDADKWLAETHRTLVQELRQALMLEALPELAQVFSGK